MKKRDFKTQRKLFVHNGSVYFFIFYLFFVFLLHHHIQKSSKCARVQFKTQHFFFWHIYTYNEFKYECVAFNVCLSTHSLEIVFVYATNTRIHINIFRDVGFNTVNEILILHLCGNWLKNLSLAFVLFFIIIIFCFSLKRTKLTMTRNIYWWS